MTEKPGPAQSLDEALLADVGLDFLLGEDLEGIVHAEIKAAEVVADLGGHAVADADPERRQHSFARLRRQ